MAVNSSIGDRGVHFLVRMTDAIDGGAARTIDILLAVDVPHIAALGAGDLGELGSHDIDVGRQFGASIHGGGPWRA
jgi:hypothetical protein